MKFNNKINDYVKSSSQIHITIINVQYNSYIEIKKKGLHVLLPHHPQIRKPNLGSSFEWLESLHQDPAACLHLFSEDYSM